MNKICCSLTVFFDAPFWVGVFEKIENNYLSAVKVTFGKEPKDSEVYDFVLKHYHNLKFTSGVNTDMPKTIKSPKRRQREANKLLNSAGTGTKSQQALALAREEKANTAKSEKHEQKIMDAKRIFELKQHKKKEKHRGR